MRKTAVVVVLVVAVAGVAWLGWRAIQTAGQARLVLDDLDRLRALSSSGDLVASLPVVRDELVAVERHLQGVQDAGRPFLWLAPHLDWLPEIGPTVGEVPRLLQMARLLIGGADLTLEALMPTFDTAAGVEGQSAVTRLVSALSAAAPSLEAADGMLGEALSLRSQIVGDLHPYLSGMLEQVDQLLPLARTALRMGLLAPGLLGGVEPQTYLILAQNSHELRATGGFISGVGVVRLANGVVTDLKLSDSYAVDNLAEPHPQPPASLTAQMGAQMLLLRDSNWSPDFPSSAAVARALMLQDQGVTTDGAIAIDLEAVTLLVSALDPLEVPGMSLPVTAGNVMAQMKQSWSAPSTTTGTVEDASATDWWRKRKDFMGVLMGAALARLQDGDNLDAPELAKAIYGMLAERHLQIAVDDVAAAQLLAEQGWDGGLRPPSSGDFLAVIDSNVGYNKTNAVVQQEIAYRVDDAESNLIATLTITYTHTALAFSADQECDRTPRYGDSYDEMTRRCYWDYLRVYVPGGSRLSGTEGLQNAVAERGERGSTVFAGDFVLRPGDQHVVTLRYALPLEARHPSADYRLFVRRQAGGMAYPLHLSAGDCRWDGILASDHIFTCNTLIPTGP